MAPIAAFIQQRASAAFAAERGDTKMKEHMSALRLHGLETKVCQLQYHHLAIQARYTTPVCQTKGRSANSTVLLRTLHQFLPSSPAKAKAKNARQHQVGYSNQVTYPPILGRTLTRVTTRIQIVTSQRKTDQHCSAQWISYLATHWTSVPIATAVNNQNTLIVFWGVAK